MNAGIFLSIVSFAISLGGLIPIFILKGPKKIIALTVIVAVLSVTTGIALFRVAQYEKLIRKVQFEIHENLGPESKTLTQLRRDLPAQRGYSDVVEALFRGVDEHVFDEDEIEFIRDGISIPVKVYFIKN